MTNETEYRRANERTSPGEVARRLTAAERRRFRSRYFRFRTVACDDLGVDLFTSEPAASVDAGDRSNRRRLSERLALSLPTEFPEPRIYICVFLRCFSPISVHISIVDRNATRREILS